MGESVFAFLRRMRFAARYVLSPTAPLSDREHQFVGQISRLQDTVQRLQEGRPERAQ